MSRLDATLAHLAPGVAACRDLDGNYNPRWGLAIYCLPSSGFMPSSPGVVLGEALAARSGLGCTLLEGIPKKIPEGAAVVGLYDDLKSECPDLLDNIPEMFDSGEYAIRLGGSALVTAPAPEGLAAGMQTLAMLILRHNEDLLPGCVIADRPAMRGRALAMEVDAHEISINLLMQVVSFAATFKSGSIQLILNDDFNPKRAIPGIDTFTQACRSFGMESCVRLSLLGRFLSGGMTLAEMWARVRAVSKVFQADRVILDDPMPADASEDSCRQLLESVIKGDSGLPRFGVDAAVITRSGLPVSELAAAGVTGWIRFCQSEPEPGLEQEHSDESFPLSVDVQAPIPGFTSRGMNDFFACLDAAGDLLTSRHNGDITISFRGIGVSHMWQNMMYPAATGLIFAWGNPGKAFAAAKRYSSLLYGEGAHQVMVMWDAVTGSFPFGLTGDEEVLVRRTAFGRWPESEEEWTFLSNLDWPAVTRHIRSGADALKNAMSGLNRNALTLSGGHLALYALSWLHCFVALAPELEYRRRTGSNEDGRTEPIAMEMYNNFLAWHSHLQEMQAESGLEFSEMSLIEEMGLQLKDLCEKAVQ